MLKNKSHRKRFLSVGLLALSFTAPLANAQENSPINLSRLNQFSSKINSFFDSEHDKYTLLNTQYLSSQPDYQELFFESQKADLKTTRNLANYISTEYKVDLKLAEEIVLLSYKESVQLNLEPLLMLSLIGIESSYRITSRSFLGAIGLTQVLPQYHQAKISTLKASNLDIKSIAGNIKLGAMILKEYLEYSNGNMTNALQRYNGSLKDRSKTYSNKVYAKLNILEKVASM